MKIGIYGSRLDKGFSRYGDGCYSKLKEFGFDCIDYNMADTDTFLYTQTEKEAQRYLQQEKALADAAEIEISQVHGPWRHPMLDATPEDRAERMEKMERSIRLTAVLGCKNWVIHPIFPFGENDAGTENAARTWDMNLAFMQKLLQYAKAHDITICLENMPFLNFSLSRPEDILRFVKTMNDDHFKICLDTGHVNVFEDLSVGDSVRLLGDEIRTFHIHDNRWSMDLHMMPFYGIIDWADFSQALRDINCQCVFSLETTPPESLPSPIFDELCLSLAKIAKHIAP